MGAEVETWQEDLAVGTASDDHVGAAPQQVPGSLGRAKLDQLDPLHRNPVVFPVAGQHFEQRRGQVVQIPHVVERPAVARPCHLGALSFGFLEHLGRLAILSFPNPDGSLQANAQVGRRLVEQLGQAAL